MDIKEKIEEIVTKIRSDKEFAAKFSKEPVKAVESVIGMDLPDDQIEALISGIKAKVSIDNAGDLFGKVKNLF